MRRTGYSLISDDQIWIWLELEEPQEDTPLNLTLGDLLHPRVPLDVDGRLAGMGDGDGAYGI